MRTERPLDPDDLPIESEQTAEERELIQSMVMQPGTGSDDRSAGSNGNGRHTRRFGLRSITGRSRGGDSAAAGG